MTDLSDAHTDRLSLRGRKAIVTGGTTGIGRAIAVLLASEGVEVFICGRDPDHLVPELGGRLELRLDVGSDAAAGGRVKGANVGDPHQSNCLSKAAAFK